MKDRFYKIRIPKDELIQGKDLVHLRFIDTENRENSYREIKNQMILESPPELIAELAENSRVTNIIEPPVRTLGFIIDHKAKQIFNDFNIADKTAFYDLKLIDRRQHHYLDYFYLHHISMMNSHINFEDSSFHIKNIITKAEEDVSFQNYSDLRHFTSNNIIKEIHSDRISIDSEMKEYDFFKLALGDIAFYVSDRLKSALEEAKITGVDFIEADFLSFE